MILLCVIVVACLVSFRQVANTLTYLENRQVAVRNQKTLDYGIHRIENRINSIEAVLGGNIRYDSKGRILGQPSADELNRLLRDFPEVQNIWIVSAKRQIVYATSSGVIGLNIADPERFYQVKSAQHSLISVMPRLKGREYNTSPLLFRYIKIKNFAALSVRVLTCAGLMTCCKMLFKMKMI